jgi:hypothetical protein
MPESIIETAESIIGMAEMINNETDGFIRGAERIN